MICTIRLYHEHALQTIAHIASVNKKERIEGYHHILTALIFNEWGKEVINLYGYPFTPVFEICAKEDGLSVPFTLKEQEWLNAAKHCGLIDDWNLELDDRTIVHSLEEIEAE